MLCCTEASPGGQTDEYCHGGDSLPHSGSTVTQNYLANTSKMWKNLKLWNANFCMPKIRWLRLWCVQFGRKDVSYDIHHISCSHNAFYRPDKTILLILFVRGGAGHLDPFEPTKNGPRGPQMASKNGLFWSYLTTFGLADTFYFFATIFFFALFKTWWKWPKILGCLW